MSLTAALILAASAAAAPAPGPQTGAGAQLASAQARAVIVQAAVVRQGSGLQQRPDAPKPQVVRRGGTVLVEFQ